MKTVPKPGLHYHIDLTQFIGFNKSRSSHQRCSVKNVLLEIPQNSQENTCAIVSFLVAGLRLNIYIYIYIYIYICIHTLYIERYR